MEDEGELVPVLVPVPLGELEDVRDDVGELEPVRLDDGEDDDVDVDVGVAEEVIDAEGELDPVGVPVMEEEAEDVADADGELEGDGFTFSHSVSPLAPLAMSMFGEGPIAMPLSPVSRPPALDSRPSRCSCTVLGLYRYTATVAFVALTTCTYSVMPSLPATATGPVMAGE